jgi:hypothetical protein
MPGIRLPISSHYISTVPFTSGTTPPRTHAKWSFPRFLIFHRLLPQVNCQQNQISPSPLLTNCINQLHPRLSHTIGHCTSSLLSFVTMGSTLSAITSVIGGSLDPSTLELPASSHRNSLALWTVDVNDVCSTGTSVSTMATTTNEGRVMVGCGSVMIRYRKLALRRWPSKVPLPSCSSTRGFYSRGHLSHVNGQSGDSKRLSDPGTHSLGNLNLFAKVIADHRANFPGPGQKMCNLESLGMFLPLDGPTVQCHTRNRNPQLCRSRRHR